jgi:tRNA-specific 2-thiouridylase
MELQILLSVKEKGLKSLRMNLILLIKIDPTLNEVTVGSREDLLVKTIYLKNINFLCEENELEGEFFVKVRSTGKLLSCKVDEAGKKVMLDHGEAGVSPGQACVFYKKDNLGVRVFGGGWIDKTEK